MKPVVFAFVLGIASAALAHTAAAFNQDEMRCTPQLCCDLVACCQNKPNGSCQMK